MPLSGPHEYSHLSSHLQDLRDVLVLPEPGFVKGENLPASVEDLVYLQAEAVRKCSADRPFALLGHSSGGWIAYAVTSRLESLGLFPAAVILMDTPPISDSVIKMMEKSGIWGMEEGISNRITATGGYIRIFLEWTPTDISTPLLFIRATDSLFGDLGGLLDNEDWRLFWKFPHAIVNVPGDHFTMMEKYADSTAQAIHSWLEMLLSTTELQRL